MSRDFEAADLCKVFVRVPVEGVGKQLLYFRPAELARRQADAMQYNEISYDAIGSGVLVRTNALPGGFDDPGISLNLNHSLIRTCSASMEQR